MQTFCLELVQPGGFDMVTDCVIDPMHCIHVNIMKRHFQFATGNKKLSDSLISPEEFKIVGENFASNKYPKEFHRRPRNFNHLTHFKASEQRMLLLYGYEIFSEGHYPPLLHDMVLCLAAATRIISDSNLVEDSVMLDIARELFFRFVDKGQDLFGEHFVTMNTHLLTHITDDAEERRESVDRHSCFKYENTLKSIKRLCTGTKRPLLTLTNKLGSDFVLRSNITSQIISSENVPVIRHMNSSLNGDVYTCQFFGRFLFSNLDPDCYLKHHAVTPLRKNVKIISRIIGFKPIFDRSDVCKTITCRQIFSLDKPAWKIEGVRRRDKKKDQQFLTSCELGVFDGQGARESERTIDVEISDIICKYVRLETSNPNHVVFYPMLPIQ